MQYLRSLIFNIAIYAMMAIYAVLFFIPALISRDWAFKACHAWCVFVRWMLRWLVGLETEVRGTPPDGEVVIAAKHQSFLDIIMIYNSVPRGKFIMKRELMYAPFLGQYGLRIGCVPVDRGKRGAAIEKMKRDVEKGRAEPGQLIIYPQGTRVAPGVKRPYKVGTGVLYEQLGQPCVPVAANVGYFWPKRGVLRKPGKAVVEFLDPIPPGLPVKEFMATLEEAVEQKSDALLDEAKRGGV
ncbi:MAG: lysophospholipid acyltransferase family protein [Paracoccaceae bacterium]|nr:lysophospholipid acyltransferase family protein [Paracoccaceae bacterium]